MNRIIVVVFALFIALPAFAQMGNEWINPGQEYFKIPVAKDGIYRLTYSNLLAAGFPVSGDPKNVQLFHRGIQQAIVIAGENDGAFDATDYIEFYGRKNDGTADTELYATPEAQPHRYYNLFTDTTSYFLTIGGSTGKRMETDAPAVTGLPEAYHNDQKLLVLTNQYSSGIDYGNVQQTVFDIGEGWMGPQILQNQTGTYTVTGIANGFAAGGKPQIEILLTGRGPMAHQATISANGRLINTISFTGFESYKHVQQLEWTDIAADGKVAIAVKVLGFGGLPDRLSVGYISITYPQVVTMSGATEKFFYLAENVAGESYMQIQNAPANTRLFDVTNPTSVSIITSTTGATLDAMVSNTESVRKILATSVVNTPVIKKVTFRNILPGQSDYVIISHPLLRNPAGGYADPVKAYAGFRASDAGGNFDTLVVNIQQLYDQFNYGEQSPLGIFHFMKFLASGQLPRYLLLIGKGLNVNYGYYRSQTSFPIFKDLVPTAGFPGSDMAFTAGLDGNEHSPAVATGRISASSPDDVANYLNKVKETEARPFDDLRRKNILHLSGGIEEHEPLQFRLFMQDFQNVAESFYLGAHVTPIPKQSTDIKLINIADEVNKGVGMVTFFGHSAPTTQDFDIGYVTNAVLGYNNPGKYPVLLMNGCDAGASFLNTTITGENWVNAPNLGASAFIAHSAYGLVFSLKGYSDNFYDVAFADPQFLNKGVAEVQKEVARRYLDQFGTTPQNITQVQQMVLLGDPALRIFGAQKPDYEITEGNLSIASFDGKLITARSDSFKLNMVIRNFGIAIDHQFRVEVTRTLNDNTTIVYDSIFNPVLYSDTLSFTIRNQGSGGFGNNTFSVNIEADNIIEELNEANNTLSLTYFIPLNATQNLFPADFAIVNNTNVSLALQSTDLLDKERQFLVEVDTTLTFASAYKKQFTVTGKVLARQQIALLETDTTVYYWRTRLAQPTENESADWSVSSFTYIIDGPEGWAQVEFSQLLDNPSVGLVKDTQVKRLKFEESLLDIRVRTYAAAANKPRDSVSVRVNGVEYNLYHENNGATGCRNNTINLVAFDRKSTKPYAALNFKWYEIQQIYGGRRLICGREPYITNSFTPTELVTGNKDDLIEYVNRIPAGDTVMLYSIGNAGYASWPAAAKAKLAEFGISTDQLNSLQAGEGVVIFGRKGAAPGSAQLHRTSAQTDPLRLKVSRTITGRYNSGTMTSALIGPSSHWEEFLVKTSEAEAQDNIDFSIVGVKANGAEEVLLTGLSGDTDLTGIDPTTYPYLKVVFSTSDDLNLTAVQLKQWLLIYEPMAEGMILYKGTIDTETVAEGTSWTSQYAFVNISDHEFTGPLKVNYKAVNVASFATASGTMEIEAPMPGDTTAFSIVVETDGQAGLNDVEVFVNPYLIPEQYYDNNIINLSNHLDVLRDNLSPVLDVTVDGRHLAAEDVVSPNPDIAIMLWDENRNLLKKDTLGLQVYLAYPCETDDCEFTRIYFSRSDMSWAAATSTEKYTVHFKPNSLPAGKYTLRVEARDASGNKSAVDPYEITFVVVEESGITVLPVFPNPFHYKTTFRFVISGSSVPEAFNMEIANLNGRVVQQFTGRDIPALHIGTNTIHWAGTDREGNTMSNGMYVYRMRFEMGGKRYQVQGKVILTR